MHKICFIIGLFHASPHFELIIGRSKLYYTASGIITLCRCHVLIIGRSKLCYTTSGIITLYRCHVLIIGRSKLYYTAFGIITPIGVCPVHRLREDLCIKLVNY